MAEENVNLPASRSISELLGSVKQEVNEIEQQMTSEVKQKMENIMADTIMTPTMPMLMGGGGYGNDGLFGGGGGLVGGLILGSLLRNNGNLFGGGGDAALGATLRNPPEQNQANMDLMAGIGQVDKAVAVSTAAMEASQAAQSAGIVSQLNNVTGSLATRVEGVKDAVNANAMVLAQQINGLEKSTMENRYELSKDISADGDKTLYQQGTSLIAIC